SLLLSVALSYAPARVRSFLFFFYSYRAHRDLHSFPTRRSSDLHSTSVRASMSPKNAREIFSQRLFIPRVLRAYSRTPVLKSLWRSEEHTSELQSRFDLVCRLLLEKKKKQDRNSYGCTIH